MQDCRRDVEDVFIKGKMILSANRVIFVQQETINLERIRKQKFQPKSVMAEAKIFHRLCGTTALKRHI